MPWSIQRLRDPEVLANASAKVKIPAFAADLAAVSTDPAPVREQWRVPAASVGQMPTRERTIDPGTPVLAVERMFMEDATLSSIVVSDATDAVCITRAWFFAQLTGPLGFGRSLYGRHPVGRLPRRRSLVIPSDTGLADASRAALGRPEDTRYDDLVVSFADRSFGTICVADLFAEVAHSQAYEALHDNLTGLPNRRLFLERLNYVRAQAELGRGGLFAVLFVDVDEFKAINDVLGHEAGDHTLSTVAERLAAVRGRAGDPLKLLVARLGGDEFAILVEQAQAPEEVLAVVEQVTSSLNEPLWVNGERVALSASIGIACSSEASSIEELLGNADLAMYAAKRKRKGSHAVYEERMHAQARKRLELRSQLDGALERGEFELVYQPIIQLNGLSVAGAEVLLRWSSPHDGSVPPDQFIPLCEQSGMIVPLGAWVLEQACSQVMRWDRAHRGRVPPRLSVNISPRQLQEPGFVDEVAQILRITGMRAKHLCLEITEGIFIDDVAIVLDRLAALKTLGVRLALDDFGAGFSSLGYLARLPIDVLKLDRTFVAQLGNEQERGLLRGIVALAESLGLPVVAEGVETEQQVTELRAAGCRSAQGYLFSRPVSPEAYAALMIQTQSTTPPPLKDLASTAEAA